jgi:hypothetical protein
VIKDLGALAMKYGVSLEDAEDIAARFDDVVPQPDGEWFTVKPSPIHGWGVFDAKTSVTIFEGGLRTLAGRYLNHGETTGTMVVEGINLILIPNKSEGELFIDYEECIDLQKKAGFPHVS